MAEVILSPTALIKENQIKEIVLHSLQKFLQDYRCWAQRLSLDILLNFQAFTIDD